MDLERASVAELARIDQLFTFAERALANEEAAPVLEWAYFGCRLRNGRHRDRAMTYFYETWRPLWLAAHARRATSVQELAAKAGMVWRCEVNYRRSPEDSYPADYLVKSLCQDAFALAKRERSGAQCD